VIGMKKKIIPLIFLILFSLTVHAKGLEEIGTIKGIIKETSYYNNRKTEKEYRIKSILPDKIYKEMLSPEINRGEIYIYSGEEKLIYYPILEQTVSQKIDEDENFIIKVIKDLKNPENLTILKKENKICSLEYDNGLEIIFKDHEKIGEYFFPMYVDIYDDGYLVSEISFEQVELDLPLDEKEFRIGAE
jgi:outer membrane lipoprotein-sorting protein